MGKFTFQIYQELFVLRYYLKKESDTRRNIKPNLLILFACANNKTSFARKLFSWTF